MELNWSVIVMSECDREVEEKEKELLRKKQDLDRREQEMETQQERQRQKAKKSLPEVAILSSGDEDNDEDYENISGKQLRFEIIKVLDCGMDLFFSV